MLTILDFAKLSLYVYNDSKQLANYIKGNHLIAERFELSQQEDGMYEIFLDRLAQGVKGRADGFYASFFVQVRDQRATGGVIAIRGTDNFENDRQDVKSWWHSIFDHNANVIPPTEYMQDAYRFYSKVRRFISERIPSLRTNRLFVTGHSLGGAIAALLPTVDAALIRAVTFNAPGIKEVPRVDNMWSSVINLRARYDFVSAIDEPIGPVWDLMVLDHVQQAEKAFEISREHAINGKSRLNVINDLIELSDFLDSVKQQHSMANLLDTITASFGGIASDSYDHLEHIFSEAEQQDKSYQLNSPFTLHSPLLPVSLCTPFPGIKTPDVCS